MDPNLETVVAYVTIASGVVAITFAIWKNVLPWSTPDEWWKQSAARKALARQVKIEFLNSGGPAIRITKPKGPIVYDFHIELHALNRTRRWKLWKPRWIYWGKAGGKYVQAAKTDFSLDFADLEQRLEKAERVNWGAEVAPQTTSRIKKPDHGFLLHPKPIYIKVDVTFTLEDHSFKRAYVVRPWTENPRCRFLENLRFDRIENYHCWVLKPQRKWWRRWKKT